MTPQPPSRKLPSLLAPTAFLAAGAVSTTGSRTPFDTALFLVSDYLVEARLACDTDDGPCQAAWYGAAEACALQTGYLELMRLVWGESDNAAPAKNPAHPRTTRRDNCS